MSFFDDEFDAPATKFAPSGGAVLAEDPFSESIHRGVMLPAAMLASNATISNELFAVKTAKAPIAPVAAAPALPGAPFFLEKTHVRSTAPSEVIVASLKRALGEFLNGSFDWNASKFKGTAKFVKEFTGVEIAVKVYSDALTAEHVVEFACLQSRSRMAFMSGFPTILASLVKDGVITAAAAAPFSKAAPPALKPLDIPADLAVRADVCPETLSPLHSMLRSSCASVRREGMAVLASIAANASPRSASIMRDNGTLALLKECSSTLGCDFEASMNCASAIANLETA